MNSESEVQSVSRVHLARTLDLAAAPPLWRELALAKGTPLSLDASEVERLGGACLQVLIAAAAAWRAAGVEFSIVSPSDAFMNALSIMGVEQSIIWSEAS